MSEASDFVYTAADFLGRALKSGWSPRTLPVGVVYTFQNPVALAIAEQTDRFAENHELTVSNARMFMTIDNDQPVMVACLNPGAASMVTQLEHLRLLSNDRPLFAVIAGTCGAIAGPHVIGDLVLANTALRSEGISDSYLPPAPDVQADPLLLEALSIELGEPAQATTWTVAVPYRSTRPALLAARQNGAHLVEMEAAVLYAAGAALNVRCSAALVVSDVHRVDEPVHVDWSDTVQPTLKAVDAAIRAIRNQAAGLNP